ncbi:fructosamine kinase family protein [Hwanghaeella grinnelliae]|uniref:fructosamine kinase family protein n=1 Tax=Hwanghaeella grinnelliae TaxID=2500179 RepID=UPI0013865FF7|nr:fructosamine kinase family protein [Hwanghaeella grinnelliae]
MRLTPLAGGCLAEVLRVDLADGRAVVVKAGRESDRLDIEGRSLQALGEKGGGLPVPRLDLVDPDLLVMEHLPNDGGLDATAQRDAARYIATLHAAPRDFYGYDEDTRIGPLHQPNPPADKWVPFYRDHRLLFMGRVAMERGGLSAAGYAALETLAGRLESLIGEPEHPSLLHGDLWTGNVLASGGRITGFIDPATYHGDAEMDLAFSTLFGTFGEDFFDAYREIRPFDYAGFLDTRRDLFNLYPLLVHTALFGGGYANSVSRIVQRFTG